MAVTNKYSGDRRFFTNENHPPFVWTCVVCWSMCLTGNRPAHKIDCDKVHAVTEAAGFGRSSFGADPAGQ